MDLTKLYKLLKSKGYHYFEGNSDSNTDDIYIYFSTGFHGRGKGYEIRIGKFDNDLDSNKNISSDTLINLIKQERT